MEIINKLDKNLMFLTSYCPYDFQKNMGVYAVELKWTDGDTQMLTTPTTKPERSSDRGDFKSEEDYFTFLEYLKTEGFQKHV